MDALSKETLREARGERFGESDSLIQAAEYYEGDEGGGGTEGGGSSSRAPRMKDSLLAAGDDRALAPDLPRAAAVRRRMFYLTFMSALGGFLFGYDTGVVSGAMLKIRDDLDLDPAQQEVVVTSTVVACAACSLLGGRLNDRYGRRPVILLSAAVFTLGALCMGLAPSYYPLVGGRVVVGCGIGFASLTTPMYIAECAAPAYRGVLVTVNVLCIASGQFIAGMIDGLLADAPGGWRFMLGGAALPSLGMLLGFFPLPESPRWLVQNGRREEGLRVLRRFRATDAEAEGEVNDIVDSLLAHEALRSATASVGESPFSHAPTRRALKLGCGLMFLQQFAGINTVMYYAASIYEMSGFSTNASIWLSGFTALAQVAGIAVSIALVERKGRRPLLLASLAGVMGSLVLLGLSFFLARRSSDPVT